MANPPPPKRPPDRSQPALLPLTTLGSAPSKSPSSAFPPTLANPPRPKLRVPRTAPAQAAVSVPLDVLCHRQAAPSIAVLAPPANIATVPAVSAIAPAPAAPSSAASPTPVAAKATSPMTMPTVATVFQVSPDHVPGFHQLLGMRINAGGGHLISDDLSLNEEEADRAVQALLDRAVKTVAASHAARENPPENQ